MRENAGVVFLLILSTLLLPVASAKEIVLMGVSDSIISVAVILGFVGILLYLGGAFKFSGAGSLSKKIPWSFVAFLIFLLLVFVAPMFVKYPSYIKVDPSWQTQPLPEYAAKILVMLGLPEDWMYVQAIIYLFIIPFTAIYVLTWAFLNDLKIFQSQKNVNRVLAFLIAFSTIPLGYFMKLVNVLFAFLGGYSVAMFAAMFIVGVFGRGYSYSVKQYEDIVKRRRELRARIASRLSTLLDLSAQQIRNEIATMLNEPETVAALSPGEINRLRSLLTMENERSIKNALRRFIRSL